MNYDDQNLTEEELEIENDLENYSSVLNLEDEKEKISNYKFLKPKKAKRKAVNLRLRENDIIRIKQMANREGIPYQTLLTSLIHKIANKDIKLTVS